jgi:AcrR family transcriptional regulator
MKRSRIDIAAIRREQIVEAAVAIIAEQGLPNLSLSEIEKRAGMSRGQLTYYFPAKEDILLAVFDRVLQLMYQRIGTPAGRNGDQAGGWAWIGHLLETVPEQPRVSPDFHTLQYTFLAQMGHRKDFRHRLAKLYEEWRSNMGQGLAADLRQRKPVRPVEPRALATLVQAILHGLVMQHAVDPASFQTSQMLNLCLDVLSVYLWGEARNGQKNHAKSTNHKTNHQRKNPRPALRQRP